MSPNPVVALALTTSLVATGCAALRPPAPPPEKMVSVHGDPEVFSTVGRRSFPHSKTQCFEAVARTFKTTGHGLDKADLESGNIVSGKTTVWRAVTTATSGAAISRTEDTKFYVRVTGSDAACDVAVVKLRYWRGAMEAERVREAWLVEHLRAFMMGVEQELQDTL